jgi:hypothetical protein
MLMLAVHCGFSTYLGHTRSPKGRTLARKLGRLVTLSLGHLWPIIPLACLLATSGTTSVHVEFQVRVEQLQPGV